MKLRRIEHLAAGADTVILGCTEIPLLISAADLPAALVVDGARVHGDAIFERAASLTPPARGLDPRPRS